MSNSKTGLVLHESIERLLDDFFVLSIEGTGCLIEKENLGLLQDRSGDGESLFLSSGDLTSLGTNLSIETFSGFGEVWINRGVIFIILKVLLNEPDSIGLLGSEFDISFSDIFGIVSDVFPDSSVEDDWLLGDDSEVASELSEVVVHDIDSVQ